MPEVLSDSSYELVFKNYHDWNAHRPSHTLIFRHNGSVGYLRLSEWIKVQIRGRVSSNSNQSIITLRYRNRRSTFRIFVRAIDFDRL